MIGNKLSSKKAVMSIIVIAVIAISAFLYYYFSLPKKSQEAVSQVKTNQMAAVQPTSTSDQAATATSTPAVTPTDLSSGYWFTPHAAIRSITFLENYQFKFNEGDSEGTFDSGNFAINGSTVTLKFNDHNKKDIVLEFSEDHDVQYLTNDQGEYFVHTDDDSAATQTSTDLSSGQKNTIEVTIMVPKDENNYDNYKQAIYKYTDGNGKDPSKTWIFVKKQVIVPYTADVVKASAEAAAGEIPTSGGPDKASIAYLKIKDGTAYVLLDIDEDGWAGVSYTIGYIHPLVEKTLLQFPEIKKVVFNFAPGDNSNSKSISGIIKK